MNFEPLNPAGALPRKTVYGEESAREIGLQPIHEVNALDVIDWHDMESAINAAIAAEAMPIHYQHATWAPPGFKSNQNGLNFCWAWSLTAATMDLRALEGKDTTILAPVSLGWLVGWKNRGYYLDDTIRGARERGIAPAEYCGGDFNSTNRSRSTYREGWEDEALRYRLGEVWDIDTNESDRYSKQQAATVLCSGRPIYLAYDWWGHALMCAGMKWESGDVVWQIRNSHNEPDIIEMKGPKGVPDEMYGLVSTILA